MRGVFVRLFAPYPISSHAETLPMNNTRFSYLYRDGANCKQHHSIVLQGLVTCQQVEPFLDEGDYFIPSQVTLPDLQKCWEKAGFPLSADLDHAWHEITDIAPTDEAPTVRTSAADLAHAFATVKWDEAAAMATLKLT